MPKIDWIVFAGAFSAAMITTSFAQSSPPTAPAEIAIRAKAIAAGNRIVHQKFPDFKAVNKSPVLTDKGKYWEYTYQLPATMIGGAPVVVIRKSDLSVIKAYHSQ